MDTVESRLQACEDKIRDLSNSLSISSQIIEMIRGALASLAGNSKVYEDVFSLLLALTMMARSKEPNDKKHNLQILEVYMNYLDNMIADPENYPLLPNDGRAAGENLIFTLRAKTAAAIAAFCE